MKRSKLNCLLVLSVALTCFLASPGTCLAVDVTLGWDASTSPNVVGYKFYYGFSSGSYLPPIDVGNNLSYKIQNLEPGKIYHIAITSYDVNLNESTSYSTEYSYAPGGYLLWANAAGQTVLWELDINYDLVPSHTHTFGPYSGWTPLSFTRDKYGVSYLLWKSPTNQADIWFIGSALNNWYDYRLYPPDPGWTPLGFYKTYADTGYIHWRSSAGQEKIWAMNSFDVPSGANQQPYGPYSGWTLSSLTAYGAVDYELWISPAGKANIWIMNSLGGWYDYRLYGPYAGWWPVSFYASELENKGYLLWKSPSGTANLWIMNDINGWSDYRLFNLAGFVPIGYFKH